MVVPCCGTLVTCRRPPSASVNVTNSGEGRLASLLNLAFRVR